jgi:hypothetical protein
MKNAVFWDVKPCGSCDNRRFVGTYRLHHQGENISELGTMLVTAKVVASSLILLTLTMEEICFSDTSVLTKATRHHIPEDESLRSHRRENL